MQVSARHLLMTSSLIGSLVFSASAQAEAPRTIPDRYKSSFVDSDVPNTVIGDPLLIKANPKQNIAAGAVIQSGRNLLYVDQAKTNGVDILQVGEGNVAALEQTGKNNRVYITQGYDLTSPVRNANNSLAAVQQDRATDSVAYINQYGTGHDGRILQSQTQNSSASVYQQNVFDDSDAGGKALITQSKTVDSSAGISGSGNIAQEGARQSRAVIHESSEDTRITQTNSFGARSEIVRGNDAQIMNDRGHGAEAEIYQHELSGSHASITQMSSSNVVNNAQANQLARAGYYGSLARIEQEQRNQGYAQYAAELGVEYKDNNTANIVQDGFNKVAFIEQDGVSYRGPDNYVFANNNIANITQTGNHKNEQQIAYVQQSGEGNRADVFMNSTQAARIEAGQYGDNGKMNLRIDGKGGDINAYQNSDSNNGEMNAYVKAGEVSLGQSGADQIVNVGVNTTGKNALKGEVFYTNISVGQAGDGSRADIAQSGTDSVIAVAQQGENGLVSVNQSGSKNIALLRDQSDGSSIYVQQAGSENHVSAGGVTGSYEWSVSGAAMTTGNNNALGISQDGSKNQLQVSATGDANSLYSTQKGLRNSAELHVTGSGNVATIATKGNDNVASVEIQGNTNRASINQDGLRNEAALMIVGNANEAGISTVGNDNLANIGIEGTLNYAAIQAKGNGNFASISQEGSNNFASIVETGNKNNIAIDQTNDDNVANLNFTGSNNRFTLAQDGGDTLNLNVKANNFAMNIKQ
jgi:hypothetical protein